MLVSDGQKSFVLFLYADGEIQWTLSDGLGGVETLAGFSAADGTFFLIPGSQTPAIINIDSTSNVGRAGVWIFRVDQEENPNITCNNFGESTVLTRGCLIHY